MDPCHCLCPIGKTESREGLLPVTDIIKGVEKKFLLSSKIVPGEQQLTVGRTLSFMNTLYFIGCEKQQGSVISLAEFFINAEKKIKPKMSVT